MTGSHVATALGVTTLRGSTVGLIAKAAGFDALFIDLEHSPTDILAASETCIAALGHGVTPLVRCTQEGLGEGVRLLDNGALGLVVAQVDTLAQAENVVRACRHPPKGKRGVGRFYPQLDYRPVDWTEAGAQLEAITSLFLMIETREGVGNAEAIAGLDGVDGLFIGAGDLTLDIGLAAGHDDASAVLEAGLQVARACRKHNKLLGFGGWTEDDAIRTMIANGARLIIAGSDLGLCISGGAAATARIRSLSGIARTPD